jgi:TRAP-type C4-dicarboxylate transport system permease small subunit
MDPAIKFYREQWRRYLLPGLVILVLDFLLLFVWTAEFPGRLPIIAVCSGFLGGFVRVLFVELISADLHDTANMFRYWIWLVVGSVLGLASYLLLLDARLFKFVYPALPLQPGLEPNAISAAIFGGFFGMFAREIVAAGQKFTTKSK